MLLLMLALLCGLAPAGVYGQIGAADPSQDDPFAFEYLYDLNTGELYLGSSASIPPTDAPSGDLVVDGQSTGQPAGVRAYVYSCTSCDDRDALSIAWLETFTIETRETMRRDMKRMQQYIYRDLQLTPLKGHLVAKYKKHPLPLEWVDLASEQGSEIVSFRPTCADGQPAERCRPAPPAEQEQVGRSTPRGYVFAAIGAVVLLAISIAYAGVRRLLRKRSQA